MIILRVWSHLIPCNKQLITRYSADSFAHIQKFMSECLGIFNDHPLVFVTGDLRLRVQVLEMVAQYCSDQARKRHIFNIALVLIPILACSPSNSRCIHDFTSYLQLSRAVRGKRQGNSVWHFPQDCLDPDFLDPPEARFSSSFTSSLGVNSEKTSALLTRMSTESWCEAKSASDEHATLLDLLDSSTWW